MPVGLPATNFMPPRDPSSAVQRFRSAWRATTRLVLVGGLVLAAVELCVRSVVPVPEVLNFDRLAYSTESAERARANPQSMAHGSGWWVSAPDDARFSSRFNLYGFRDGDWSVLKPSSRVRIAFVGDSFVEGLGASDVDTMPSAFARRLHRAGVAVDAMNFGAGAFGLREYFRLIRDLVPIFKPDHLVLVLYMNDLYEVPRDPGPLLAGPLVPRWSSGWDLRIRFALTRLRAGHTVPLRWHRSPGPPRPYAVGEWLGSNPELVRLIDRDVAPDIARHMKAGWFNPAVAGLARRSERVLPGPVEMAVVLRRLDEFLSQRSVRLWVAYLPSLNQVSNAYLPAQSRLSSPIDAASLTSATFQQQARDLSRAAARRGIPFLDLTAPLQEEEARGRRLY
jgi:hypothetical protein